MDPLTTNPSTHIPSLDGIRAISFLLVFVAHAGLGHIVPGGLGVTVFFFLSGYLITTLARLELEATGTFSLRGFYLRRLLRIFPPLWTILTIALVLGLLGVLAGDPRVVDVLSQYLFFFNYVNIDRGESGVVTGTGVFWSLAVEEHFYFIFPVAFLLAARRGWDGRRISIVLASIGAIVLTWRTILALGLDASEERIFYATDTRIDAILLGCILALVGNPHLDSRPRIAKAPAVAAALGGVTLILASVVVRQQEFRDTLRYSLQTLALFPIFWAAVRYPTAALFRPLAWRVARWVGRLSYSLYLIHFIVIRKLEEAGAGSLVLMTAGLAISLALAEVVQITVERPCARLRRQLHARAPARAKPLPTPAPGAAV